MQSLISLSSKSIACVNGSKAIDESKLGDVLLFRTGALCTRVVSRYGQATCYTIVNEGTKAIIYRGERTSIFGGANHIATVTTALSTTQRLKCSALSAATAVVRTFSDAVVRTNAPLGLARRRDEKSEGEEKDDETLVDEKVSGSKPCGEKKIVRSGPRNIQTDDGLLFVEFGAGAPKNMAQSLRFDGSKLVVRSDDEEYAFRPGPDTQLELHARGRKNGQVVWTRPPHAQVDNHQVVTISPATLTFYPEVRPFLDAVIIALVVWEKKTGTWLST